MSDGFKPLDPPRFKYVDVAHKSSEELALDNVGFYIRLLEGRISRAMVALDQGIPAYEVAKILQGYGKHLLFSWFGSVECSC